MKVSRHTVKATRSCDDWDDDYPPYYETGSSYELSDETPRFRSVSPAAHRAMHQKPITTAVLGFHRPKP